VKKSSSSKNKALDARRGSSASKGGKTSNGNSVGTSNGHSVGANNGHSVKASNGHSSSPALTSLLTKQYQALREMAGRILRSERLIKSSKINRQMSPTSLVAESTLQLLAQRVKIQGEDHLQGLANISMQRVLSDRARKGRALKRSGNPRDLLKAEEVKSEVQELAIMNAIEALRAVRPRQAEVITAVCLKELSIEQAATSLKMTVPTLNRDLRAAREWLSKRLK
jgi:RNA polymerase sigma-70 factor, ECF subfamily